MYDPTVHGEDVASLRDQWNNWARVLDRIKQDEQRWISVAFLVFGGLFAVAIGRIGTIPTSRQELWKPCVYLGLILTASHLVAFAWVRHTLVLRKQYYRAMAESYLVRMRLGWRPPSHWCCKWAQESDERWREEVTRPVESIQTQKLTMSGMVILVNIAGASRWFFQYDYAGSILWCIFILFVVFSLAGGYYWWRRGFDKLDRENMRKLYEEPCVAEFREMIVPESGQVYA